jgi:hypothetical protein
MKPGLTIDPTDVVAVVLMAIFSMRRMDIRATDVRAFPGVSLAAFDDWKRRALAARAITINACFAKFALNSIWFFGFRNVVPRRLLMAGGIVLFVGWIAALMYAWWRFSQAKADGTRLGIVIGRRIVEATPDATRETPPDEPEARSR